jgi:hypothetical protein
MRELSDAAAVAAIAGQKTECRNGHRLFDDTQSALAVAYMKY